MNLYATGITEFDRHYGGGPPEPVLWTPPPQSERVKFSLTWSESGELFLVASVPAPVAAGCAAAEVYGRIAKTLRKHRLTIVHERDFGSLIAERSVMAERSRAFLAHGIPTATPVTYIQGHPVWGVGLAGVIIQAVPAGQVRTLLDGDVPCGRAWQSDGAEFLVIQNITGLPDGPGEPKSRSLQVRRMLDRADRVLREQGGSYRDVVRTWFYLSDILEWYPEFNKVRNEQYGEFGIMPGPDDGALLLPASTGICGDTRSEAAATMDLIAVFGASAALPKVVQLTNRGQLDAFRYGAAFSRGALIRSSDAPLFHLSGTAAIDERGKSLFADDISGQIGCTLDKVEALMSQVGAGLRDICAATVYVKRPEYADVFREITVERGLADLPVVCIVADVCREELLFEIDAEALVAKS
jgi:enamine deaminase RidA (YjgF/YER057c/UK114 family)